MEYQEMDPERSEREEIGRARDPKRVNLEQKAAKLKNTIEPDRWDIPKIAGKTYFSGPTN